MSNIIPFPLELVISEKDAEKDKLAKSRFLEARKSLHAHANQLNQVHSETYSEETTKAIHGAIEYAIVTGNWKNAKTRIDDAMRREKVKIVKI